ncbi:transglycosylase domain-containing protein [Actinocorallia aurantiaca]|uniref:Transglycosylase domain-containing protein n=1 Tax=Actinocorallia aurantiaca TaxID=46204 RepID=A0ABP6GA91_9ACTN
MSNPTYGPGHGAPGHEPEDDWFRPAPQAREEIYRESEYGNSAPPQFEPYQEAPYDGGYGHNGNSVHSNGYDAYSDGGQSYDAPYAAPNGQEYGSVSVNGADPYSSMGRAGVNGSTGYDDGYGYGDPGETRLDGAPIRDMNPPGGGSGDGDGGDDGKPGREGWKKYLPNWKIVAGVCALGLVASITLVGVGYATTETPNLEEDVKSEVLAQGSKVYWAKSKPTDKPMFQIGGARELVTIDKIPEHVRQAVMAAEQREFMTEGGISLKGLTRAVYTTVTGGQVQGGSTITQQLARNYLQGLSQERSLSRKYKEIFSAIKMDNAYPKDDILEAYLNTIDYGRNSQGIQAASRAYFGINVDKLNIYQGALLAAMIQRPSYFKTTGDPAKVPELKAAQERWEYVLDGMVKKGWMTADQRKNAVWPDTASTWNWSKGSDQSGYIHNRILHELKQVPGVDVDHLSTKGYKITLSLEKRLMVAAKNAVLQQGPKLSKKQKKLIRTGLVAVDPENGEIRAFYGGDHKLEVSDAALVENKQVGSSFKPYVLAAMLKQNHNIKSLIEGRSPICLNGATGDVIPGKNSEDACDSASGYWLRSTHGGTQAISMTEAMAQSNNTSFVRLALKLDGGLDTVIDTARQFGIPERYEFEKVSSLPLGVAGYPALYQASGYAAFANGGKRVTPHMVTKVVDASGKEILLPWKKQEKQVLTKDQADQVTYTLQQVVTRGTGQSARLLDRQAAGKTGTTEGGAATWFVGYTPQLSAAATVFHQKSESMQPFIGERASYGGVYPAAIWKAFMTEAMKGVEPKVFDAPTYSGTQKKFDTPKPKPTKTEEECNPLMQLAGQCGDGNNHGNPNPQDLPGCSQGQLPPAVACDPNKPPPGEENNPPDWWCPWHRDYPACQGNGNGNGNPNQPVDADGDGIPAGEDQNDNDPNYPNPQHP